MNTLDIIKAALPWIGTALGGPLGGAAASFVGDKLGIPAATVDTVKSVLAGMSPEKLAEFKAHDDDFAFKMAQAGYDQLYRLEQLNVQAATQSASDVNKTMQAEVGAEHWPSYSWRPFIGFMFGLYIAAMFILPLFHVTPVKLDSELVLTIGAILGVASFFRGKAQADPNVQNTSNVTQKG
jgi:hypothetical protein